MRRRTSLVVAGENLPKRKSNEMPSTDYNVLLWNEGQGRAADCRDACPDEGRAVVASTARCWRAWAAEALALARNTQFRERSFRPSVGPNGFPTGQDEEGNFVEWIPGENSQKAWPLVLRRSEAAIEAAHDELRSKIWWHRARKSDRQDLQARLRAIEARYGREQLDAIKDVEWLIMLGRMSALGYVLGAEWNESMDLSDECPADKVAGGSE